MLFDAEDVERTGNCRGQHDASLSQQRRNLSQQAGHVLQCRQRAGAQFGDEVEDGRLAGQRYG